jgi:hypothetical protein
MSSHMKTWRLVALLMLSFSVEVNADLDGLFDPCDASARVCNIYINEDITPQTLSRVKRNLDEIRGKYPRDFVWVNLNSAGGDVASAMEIGSVLRGDTNHAVRIAADASCLSSCVFILAGATQRQVFGKVGIHRPYYQQVENLSHERRSDRYAQLIEEARQYFDRMHIRSEIVDAMVSVPPEKIKMLTYAEQSYYGLNRVDPVAEEEHDDILAKKYHLRKADYYRLKTIVNERCEGSKDYNSCAASIFTQ